MHKQENGTYIESPFHIWFGLSYASYLVIPRLALESMSPEWQSKMIALLDEANGVLSATPDYHVLRDDPEYTHVANSDPDDETSDAVEFTVLRDDPWANYRRGSSAELVEGQE